MLSVTASQWFPSSNVAEVVSLFLTSLLLPLAELHTLNMDVQGDEDSIPLHIMLLLMDEVFDLKSRNQWLRRRIVAILQQIAKTMFGDSINRSAEFQIFLFSFSVYFLCSVLCFYF